MPDYIYFIIKGDVFFTNDSGTFHYFKLSTGSYFGDINALLGHKSSYSVLYPPSLLIIANIGSMRMEILSCFWRFKGRSF